ncbi:M48 family metallopeptidase [Noviherbaspirillum saxi]|uniref:M48 family peptidase n=1 Tax=Noviherbaspirillum saxi TaxID=2320863 RepID=A0A3A3FJ77_9BURK|nr:M48 family metallopeptidase [Noviherbaspirillum saxi]RJF95304.1 M48 family peptidase [Noviherbaspirillum saxi]
MKIKLQIKLLVTGAVLLLGACASTTKPGVVGVTRQQLLLVPAATVERMALVSYAQQAEKAKAQGKLITSGEEYDRLLRIANRLKAQVGVFREDTRDWKWQLILIDAPVLNATCAPGGKITFYTGIVRQLKLSDDEIAAIMGHEFAHALREHGRERVSQAVAQNAITTAALAGAQNRQTQVALANQFAQYLFVLPNSRQNESEADGIGLELAARAGYDPRAAISLWQKMGRASEGKNTPEFLSTHPANTTRINEISALLPTVLPLYDAAKQ